jgi:caffeoyl-CoA O-methyltransferase
MADKDSRSGARYATPETLAFVEQHHVRHDDALTRAFEAPAKHGLPQIQISPSEGKTLTLLMQLIGARNVIEVGTLAGYSALCLARGMRSGGKLISLELEPKNAQVARDNIAFAGMSDRIEVLIGPALATLETLARGTAAELDAMFLDADKGGYPDYARWAARKLKPGGLLIADNSYFFGQLLADTPDAARMREFHAFVAETFDSACLPTPDGMVLGIRR